MPHIYYMRNGIQIKLLFIQILISAFIIFGIYKFTSNYDPAQISRKLNSTNFLLMKIDRFRFCLNLAFDEEPDKMDYIFRYRNCISKYVKSAEFDKFYMGRYGESKVFLPQRNPYRAAKCFWLTIGIGGTANAEMLFKKKYPKCKIFGIEASPDQYDEFDKYGTIIPYGVGVTNGSFDLTLREGLEYINKTVEVLEMKILLDKYIGSRIIHYMTIDIEGFEYTILEELLYGKLLYNQKIVFCQIDAELHGEDKDKAANVLHKFDSYASDYIPIYAGPFLQHEKVTWINIKNSECKKAFDLQKFL